MTSSPISQKPSKNNICMSCTVEKEDIEVCLYFEFSDLIIVVWVRNQIVGRHQLGPIGSSAAVLCPAQQQRPGQGLCDALCRPRGYEDTCLMRCVKVTVGFDVNGDGGVGVIWWTSSGSVLVECIAMCVHSIVGCVCMCVAGVYRVCDRVCVPPCACVGEGLCLLGVCLVGSCCSFVRAF